MLPFSLYKVRLSWCPNYLTGCILLPLHLLHPSFKAFLVCFYLKHAEESRVSCSRSCWKGVWCVIGCWVTAGAWQKHSSAFLPVLSCPRWVRGDRCCRGVSVCTGLLSPGQVGALRQVEPQRDPDTSLAPRTGDGSAAAAHLGPAPARQETSVCRA